MTKSTYRMNRSQLIAATNKLLARMGQAPLREAYVSNPLIGSDVMHCVLRDVKREFRAFNKNSQ